MADSVVEALEIAFKYFEEAKIAENLKTTSLEPVALASDTKLDCDYILSAPNSTQREEA